MPVLIAPLNSNKSAPVLAEIIVALAVLFKLIAPDNVLAPLGFLIVPKLV